MKALTLHQPYASLVAAGVKRIETRSWPAPPTLIGQRLAIHAGSSTQAIRALRHTAQLLGEYGICSEANEMYRERPFDEAPNLCLPLGAVVASCVVTHCLRIVAEPERLSVPYMNVSKNGALGIQARSPIPGFQSPSQADQLPFGDFAPGRYAWLLDDIAPTTERCPVCWGDHIAECDGCCEDEPSGMTLDGDLIYRGCCWHCNGRRECEPIPARGHQRVWGWTL